jgi:hypothetical protein
VIEQEENMWESPFVDEILGIGAVRVKREALLRGLQLRFPKVLTEEVRLAINNQSSLELLDAWLDAAFSDTSGKAFLAVIKSKQT